MTEVIDQGMKLTRRAHAVWDVGSDVVSFPVRRPRYGRTSARPCALVAGLVVAALLAAPGGLGAAQSDTTPFGGAWTQQDRKFADFLIRELRYYDTAERWLAAKAESRGLSENDLAQTESYRLDLLKAKGDEEGFAAALKEFQRKFPDHGRASVGGLQTIESTLQNALRDLFVASRTPEQATKLRTRAKKTFSEQVVPAIEAQIKDADAKIAGAEAEAADALLVIRNQAELARIEFYTRYGREWPRGSGERKKTLEEALAFADFFVENRSEFYVMEYDAQLKRGIIAYELGQNLLAYDHLSILYDIEPLSARPYKPAIVAAFKDLRIKAILFGSRAANAAGDYQKARLAIENFVLTERKNDQLDLSTAEGDPTLRQFAILTRLEHAVALAGDGEVERGLDSIHKIIEAYDGDAAAEAYVIDARKALGRVALIKGVTLRGQDYYQAAQGLKAELRWEDALTTFQTALGVLSPREFMTYGPICLSEIGEALFLLGRFHESAVAYAELFDVFGGALGSSELASKSARNFLAAATKTVQNTPNATAHAEVTRLNDQAKTLFDRLEGGGFEAHRATLIEADQAAKDGRFEQARKRYQEVPEFVEKDGKKNAVPFYWRAQASAEAMIYELWSRFEGEENPWEDELAAAVASLGDIYGKALAAGDEAGAATATLALGQTHYLKREWPEAATAFGRFASELEDSDSRCTGVAYYALCLARTGECDKAKDQLASIRKTCSDEPVLGYAALNVADCFNDLGNADETALHTLYYALNPRSADDLKDVDALLMVASRLAAGAVESGSRKRRTAFLKAAGQFADRVKKHRSAKEPEVRRQYLLVAARVERAKGDRSDAVKTLKAYIKEFSPGKGRNEEDPYVYRDLGEIYRTSGKLNTSRALSAEKYYDWACSLMEARSKSVAAQAVQNPELQALAQSLDQTFWDWTLTLMKLKLFLGSAGDANKFGEIIRIIEPRTASDMGGKKSDFLQILERAKEEKGL